MSRLSALREEYRTAELLESNTLADPIAQFRVWFAEAQSAGIREANAMSLATAGARGPNVRIVLLKELDTGFVFFTNYESTKAQEIDTDPRAALCFHWKELERQVRATGIVERVPRTESEAYFHSRPRGSQIGAWASRQSSIISSREEIDQRFAEIDRRFADGEIPLPDFWGGYRLIPETVEFWQGRANRLHDRLLYERTGSGWLRKRLSP